MAALAQRTATRTARRASAWTRIPAAIRWQSTDGERLPTAPATTDKPLTYENQGRQQFEESRLTPYLRKYPSLRKSVEFLYNGMGLWAKESNAIRHSHLWYTRCAERDVLEAEFFYDQCGIPKTFHAWFQITNLHVWLLTVRFRALPSPHGKYHLQALINYFFQDIEDRLWALLGLRTSQRVITGYMKEYRDLWNGSQFALDVGLVGGDWELAGAVWRNLYDARGWDLGGKRDEEGKVLDPTRTVQDSPIPFVPGSENAALLAAEAQHDLAIRDKTLEQIPWRVYILTAYLRRELKRLDGLTDEQILQEYTVGKFGRMERVLKEDGVSEGPLTSEEARHWAKPLPWQVEQAAS